jgi:hypothetical protein
MTAGVCLPIIVYDPNANVADGVTREGSSPAGRPALPLIGRVASRRTSSTALESRERGEDRHLLGESAKHHRNS